MVATAVLTKITAPVEITERELVKRLKGFLYERKHAIEFYPNAKGAHEKLEAINDGLLILDRAESCLNTTQAIRLALRVSPVLHFVAPHATRKLHETYHTKIEQLMDGCRDYLRRRLVK